MTAAANGDNSLALIVKKITMVGDEKEKKRGLSKLKLPTTKNSDIIRMSSTSALIVDKFKDSQMVTCSVTETKAAL